MALRDKIATNAAPHLQPGETIQGVLFGQTASQYLILIGYLPFVIINKYRTIVATDRRILVFDSGRFSTTKANALLGQLPRDTKLGPWSGNVWHVWPAGSEQLRIHRRFKKDIEAIDGGTTPAQ